MRALLQTLSTMFFGKDRVPDVNADVQRKQERAFSAVRKATPGKHKTYIGGVYSSDGGVGIHSHPRDMIVGIDVADWADMAAEVYARIHPGGRQEILCIRQIDADGNVRMQIGSMPENFKAHGGNE